MIFSNIQRILFQHRWCYQILQFHTYFMNKFSNDFITQKKTSTIWLTVVGGKIELSDYKLRKLNKSMFKKGECSYMLTLFNINFKYAVNYHRETLLACWRHETRRSDTEYYLCIKFIEDSNKLNSQVDISNIIVASSAEKKYTSKYLDIQ